MLCHSLSLDHRLASLQKNAAESSARRVSLTSGNASGSNSGAEGGQPCAC